MPIGIIGALGVCTILYIGVSFVLTGMVHYTKLNVSDPVAFALQVVGLNSVAGIISAGAIIGITTVLIALVYAQVRLTFAMSRDGLMPKIFSNVHPKSKTPVANTWLTGAVAACIVGFVNLSTLANLVSIGTLAAFTVISIAVIILRKKHPNMKTAFKVPFVPVLPIISAVICMILVATLKWETWRAFLIWVAIGVVVYFTYARRKSHLNQTQ